MFSHFVGGVREREKCIIAGVQPTGPGVSEWTEVSSGSEEAFCISHSISLLHQCPCVPSLACGTADALAEA